MVRRAAVAGLGCELARFAAIRAPVLMIHGAADPRPGRATFEVPRVPVPRMEYVELAKCGHTPWRERRARAEFFDVLTAWSRSTGRVGR